MPKWKYSGDVDLEHGGFYWLDEGDEDFVTAVDVIPCSDAGGPDNLFYIESGTIYLPTDRDKQESILSVIGMTPEDASRDDFIYAAKAYAGLERDSEEVIQIGKAEEPYRSGGWNPEPDTVLRGNARLIRYVERNYLN